MHRCIRNRRVGIAWLALVPCVAFAQAPKLEKLWESAATLKVPESVCVDAQRRVLYVSNIDGEPWGDDKRGSIGKVGLDGKVVQAEWVGGLSAPKGLALVGDRLYVSDMAEVVVIDVVKGNIATRIAVPGATGLNDAAAAPDGTVYFSDSQQKKVFALKNDKPEVHLTDLKGPNGLLYHEGALYVTDGDGVFRVGNGRALAPVATGIQGVLDGIEPMGPKEFLLSTWQGTVHHIAADGSHHLILDTRADKINAADIGYDREKRILYVPTFFKHSVAAYQVK